MICGIVQYVFVKTVDGQFFFAPVATLFLLFIVARSTLGTASSKFAPVGDTHAAAGACHST